jgi:hypothetical protein
MIPLICTSESIATYSIHRIQASCPPESLQVTIRFCRLQTPPDLLPFTSLIFSNVYLTPHGPESVNLHWSTAHLLPTSSLAKHSRFAYSALVHRLARSHLQTFTPLFQARSPSIQYLTQNTPFSSFAKQFRLRSIGPSAIQIFPRPDQRRGACQAQKLAQ